MADIGDTAPSASHFMLNGFCTLTFCVMRNPSAPIYFPTSLISWLNVDAPPASMTPLGLHTNTSSSNLHENATDARVNKASYAPEPLCNSYMACASRFSTFFPT